MRSLDSLMFARDDAKSMDTRRLLGNEGELIAAKYLEQCGYTIIARQWKRLPLGEIDLVARDAGELVFVEVKTRRNADFGYPEESVIHKKREKISRLIDLYLQANRIVNTPYRFDVVAISFSDDEPTVHHIRSVEM